MSIFALVLQNLGDNTPCKILDDLHPRKDNLLLKGTLFKVFTKHLFTTQNRVEIRRKNFSLF
jgi:hypothetical protein